MERRLDGGLQRLPQPAQCIESCLPLLIVVTDRYEAVQSGLGDDGSGSECIAMHAAHCGRLDAAARLPEAVTAESERVARRASPIELKLRDAPVP